MGVWMYVLGAGVVIGIAYALRQALKGETSCAGCSGDCAHCERMTNEG